MLGEGKEGADEAVNSLLGLTADLIHHIWPENRIVLGRRVCRKLAHILAAAPRVVFSRRSSQADLRAKHLISFKDYKGSIDLTASDLAGHKYFLVDLLTALTTQRPEVVSLNLSSNELGDEAFKEVISRVPRSASLTSLNFAFNQLSDDAAACIAQHLLERPPTLSLLDLAFNEIGDEGIQQLSTALQCHTSLLHLSFAYNCFEPPGAGSLATLLASQACDALTHLDIEGNVIHEQGATALAAGLAKISALRFFSMRGNYIGPEGAARIVETGLRPHSQLTELDLGDNELGDDGATALSMLGVNQLTSLDLDSNNIQSAGISALAGWFASSCSALRKLCVGNNPLEQDGAVGLEPWLAGAFQLRVLSLPRVSKSPDGIKRLLLSLDHRRAAGVPEFSDKAHAVQEFDLARNKLGPDGARQLGATVVGWRSLSLLKISHCIIDDAGLISLAPALVSAGTLKELDLSDNNLGPASGRLVAEILAGNPEMVWLKLGDNEIGDAGVQAMCDVLAERCVPQGRAFSLLRFGLSRCAIANPGAQVIARTLQCFPALTLLDLTGNDIGARGDACLREVTAGGLHAAEIELARNPCDA